MADWDDDDPSAMTTASSRWDKVVILKHMFTLKELEDDPAAMLDVKEDIREECEKLGEVTNVTLYDKEEDGIASVRFANVQSAKGCVRVSCYYYITLASLIHRKGDPFFFCLSRANF